MPSNATPRTKLLLVDDDVPTRMLLRGVLGKQGYAISEAGNGLEAISQFQADRPDLILMDVMMPELDGYEACARIRQIDGDESLPVVMLTGADDIAAIESSFNAGATDFITKPINWPLLIQRVKYALRTGALNREVRQNRLREASVRQMAGLGFWEWDTSGDKLTWTQELQALTGLNPADAASLPDLLRRVHADDRARVRSAFDLAREPGSRLQVEWRLLSGANERLVRMTGERGVQAEDSQRMYGAFQDITDSRKAEALVDYLAFHDELTGLGNRRLFIRQVRTALDKLRSGRDQVLLVGWLDLTRFNRHNDQLGEAGADRLLAMVANRLRSLATGGAEVARVGGDEFAVMWTADNTANAHKRFELLLESLEYPFKVDDQETFLGWCAGVSHFPEHGSDAEQLLNLAHESQRLARTQGRQFLTANTDPAANVTLLAALDLERSLRKALDQDEFFLVYQPQLDLRSGRIVGVESLLRWQHPTRGPVSPVQFIPVLEEMGLITAVGQWVLKQACWQAAQWSEQGLALRMGVNLSPRQFLDPNLFDSVQGAVQAAGAHPELIELEITESLAMQDLDHSIRLLERFRAEGYKIAIDDFGIGHSSLEYLLRFPLDVIKIDRAFITHITATRADRAIVRAVTSIGQTLGLQVIAEGVETQRQSDFVEALGVSEIQGYLIGKPMPPDELFALAKSYLKRS